MDSDIHLEDASNDVVAREEEVDIVRSPSWVYCPPWDRVNTACCATDARMRVLWWFFPMVNGCG